MKRVLIFSLAYYPSFVSGAEAAIKEITDRISPKDVEFHLITLLFDTRAPREEHIGNTYVYRVGFSGAYLSKILFIPLAALTARRIHKKLHVDAVWAMMTYMLLPAVLARAIGVNAPRILTLQDGDPYEKVFERAFITPFIPVLDYGFRTTDIVQVISSYLGTWPSKRGYRGAVVHIPNGANPRDLHEEISQNEIDALKISLGKKPNDVWLVNTARLVHQKGTDDTIRALTLLPKNVSFLVVGGGPDEHSLKALAKELGVEERVIFTGAVERSEVTLYRRVADIFVGPSRSEGLGNAFLSAMASKLPVVATKEGGLAEFVFGPHETHPQTAWVVEKNNPKSIALAVEDILAHPDTVTNVTNRARAMVLEKYDWDNIALHMKERVFNPVLH
jgi:glycosyltransferase involved in cell wall biosynthesis